MPRVGRTFTAKGGTIFSWSVDGTSDDIEVFLPDERVNYADDIAREPFPTSASEWVVKISGTDLEEFVAHIVSQAAEETLGRVLLFPCLQSEKKT